MRLIAFVTAIAVSAVAPYALLAAPGITVPSVTVGRNLQMYASVRLPEPAGDGGVTLTLSSDDPTRLLLSAVPDKAGSATISITIPPRFIESREFCLQGLADSGSVTYTISAAGIGSAKGTVTLVPSAIAIVGPQRIPKYPTTPRGSPFKITAVSVALDPSPVEQQVAGGSEVEVTIANSNPNVGKLQASKLTLGGGSSTAVTDFQPAAEGETTLAPVQPPGFIAPPKFATVVAAVSKPGLGITGDLYIGKDLEIGGIVSLGEAAPPGGLEVTLTSADSSKLLLSTRADQLGTASITLTVPAGKLTAPYYLQGMGDSSEVTYEAAAPGFRSRTAPIGLAPSGIIIAYQAYGPPDEKAVIREGPDDDERRFYVSLSDAKQHPVNISAFSAYLGRRTGRAADLTVQPLRPGVSATLVLRSSNPAVGTVESPLTIKSGTGRATARFTPLSVGTTVISVDTPAGFTKPNNATAVPATVRQ
ncbi:MAG: hypothetical protein ACLQVN_02110 [Bryobacteraceae bacterium]